jgi:hypothetical protein
VSDKKRNVLTIVSVFLVVLITLEILLSPNLYKDWIAQQLADNSDYSFEFVDISHSLISPGNLSLDGFALIGSDKKTLVSAKHITLNLKMWPLLSKNIVVESATISDLLIEASMDQLTPVETSPEENDEASPSEEGQALAINSLLVKEFKLDNANIIWREASDIINIENLNLNINELDVISNNVLNGMNTSAQIDAHIEKLWLNQFPLEKLELVASNKNSKLLISKFATEVFSGRIDTEASVNLADDFDTRFSFHLSNMDIQIDNELLASLGLKSEFQSESKSENPLPSEPLNSQKKLPISGLILDEVTVQNTSIGYALDEQTFSLDNLELNIKALPLVSQHKLIDAQSIKDTQSLLTLTAKGIESPPYEFQTIDAKLKMENSQLQLSSLGIHAQGIDIALQGKVNLADDNLPSSFVTKAFTLDFDEYHQQWFSQNIWPQGELKGQATINLDLATPNEALSSLSGDVEIVSEGIQLHGLSLNSILAGLEDSEKVSLLDVGSFLVTGPLGLIANQVANLGHAGLNTQGGETQISHLVVDSTIKHGVLQTKDVALSTDKFRIAFDGGIDLKEMAFKDLQFSILDEEHCATVQQTLNGKIDAPEGVGGKLASTTVIKPFTNILNQAGKLISTCEPVYSGAVKHPRSK